MREFLNLLHYELRRRSKDGFLIGYNIIFPIVMIMLLGYLSSASDGNDFTGYQYYSVVMLPFCIAMAVISAAYMAKEDANKKTALRYLFAPVSKTAFIMAKLISATVVISCCNGIMLIFAWLVCKLPIAGEMIPLMILLTAETFTICAAGLFIGFALKNFLLFKNILNLPIFVFAVLAGTFFPLGSLNKGVNLFISLSPLTWFNRGMFLCIYDNQRGVLWSTTAIAFAIGIIFAVLAVTLFRKEEFIHGNLPGYEK